MPCRNIRFDVQQGASDEWVPMALREAVCALRKSNPDKWNQVLRCEGIAVESDDVHCMHNLDGTHAQCPLHVERNPKTPEVGSEGHSSNDTEGGDTDDDDIPRNEHGVPLLL